MFNLIIYSIYQIHVLNFSNDFIALVDCLCCVLL